MCRCGSISIWSGRRASKKWWARCALPTLRPRRFGLMLRCSVGWAKALLRRAHHQRKLHPAMPQYRRSRIEGSVYFFTVALADRKQRLLVDEIELLRKSYRAAQQRLPFETLAICILPDHL